MPIVCRMAPNMKTHPDWVVFMINIFRKVLNMKTHPKWVVFMPVGRCRLVDINIISCKFSKMNHFGGWA